MRKIDELEFNRLMQRLFGTEHEVHFFLLWFCLEFLFFWASFGGTLGHLFAGDGLSSLANRALCYSLLFFVFMCEARRVVIGLCAWQVLWASAPSDFNQLKSCLTRIWAKYFIDYKVQPIAPLYRVEKFFTRSDQESSDRLWISKIITI